MRHEEKKAPSLYEKGPSSKLKAERNGHRRQSSFFATFRFSFGLGSLTLFSPNFLFPDFLNSLSP